MASMGDLVAVMRVNNAPFKSGLAEARNELVSFGRGTIGNVLGGIGIGAALHTSIDAARESLSAQRKLEAVLLATGGAAGFTAQEISAYASQLQRTTNFEDDATVSAAAVLATFRNVAGPVFKDAIALAQDMSAVMGTDLQGSMVQVGKALNDPINGITALSRVGVSFTAGQKAQIKALQESGDLMGAQRVILAELKGEFGGAAEAMADPMTQLNNALGDCAETIGMAFLPAIRELTLQAQVTADGVGELNGEVDALGAVFGWIAKEFRIGFLEVRTVVDLVATGVGFLAEGFARWGNLVGLVSNGAVESLQTFRQEMWKATKDDAFAFSHVKEEAPKAGKEIKALARGPVAELGEESRKSGDGMKEMIHAAERVFEGTRTPLEKFKAEWRETQQLFDEGLIDEDTLIRQFAKLQEEMKKASEEARKPLKDQQKEMVDDAKRMLDEIATPVDKFQQKLAQIAELQTFGALTDVEAEGLIAAAEQELTDELDKDKPKKKDRPKLEALAPETKEFFDALAATRLEQKQNEAKQTAENTQQMVAQQRAANEKLDKMVTALDDGGAVFEF